MLIMKSIEQTINIYLIPYSSPEAEFVKKCLEDSQKFVCGKVVMEIYKGCISVVSRESLTTNYNQELSSMNVHGTLSPYAATGFIEINAIRLKEWYRVQGNAANFINTKGLTKGFSNVQFNL